jgi:hypothetical protein
MLAPKRPSETATVMITAIVIVKLRRMPLLTSLATKFARMLIPPYLLSG